MKKYFIFFLLTCGMSHFMACKKFLQENPQTFISPDQYYQDSAEAVSGVNGIYGELTNTNCYGSFYEMSDIPSDLMEPGYTGNQSTTALDNLTFASDNAYFDGYWSSYYQGIGYANIAIDKISAMQGNIDPAYQRQLIGEAKFLRGLFYFNMVRWFGNIPLVVHYVSSLNGINVKQSPSAIVYDTIISDLQYAVQYLPASPQTGRAGLGAARTLLGKVYLTTGQWQQAADVLGQVIGTYSLFPTYASIWSPGNANGQEFIFCVQYLAGVINSPYSVNFAPRSSGIQAAQSYGEAAVNPNFYNSFLPGDARKGLILTSYPKYDGSGIATFNLPYSFKYFDLAVGGLSSVNYPVLRYADVLLMYAEALNEVQYGNDLAFGAINQVRQRAGIPLLDKTTMTQESFRQAVWQERAWELAFEGHRWFDLQRTNTLVQVMTADGKAATNTQTLFPIPQRELDVNPNLVQNTGY